MGIILHLIGHLHLAPVLRCEVAFGRCFQCSVGCCFFLCLLLYSWGVLHRVLFSRLICSICVVLWAVLLKERINRMHTFRTMNQGAMIIGDNRVFWANGTLEMEFSNLSDLSWQCATTATSPQWSSGWVLLWLHSLCSCHLESSIRAGG